MSTHNIFFFWRNKKNISTFLLKKKKHPYLKLCFTLNFKTAPSIRPLLGNTKGGLNMGFYCTLEYPFVL